MYAACTCRYTHMEYWLFAVMPVMPLFLRQRSALALSESEERKQFFKVTVVTSSRGFRSATF